MRYSIEGGNLPYVKCQLEAGEQILCESGAMSWMDDGIEMTTTGGGLKKMFGKLLTSEPLFTNAYTASRAGEIALASSFPGSIIAMRVTPDRPVIVQKKSFLAMTPGLDVQVFFQKRLGGGFFGGEGFIMNRFSGNGLLFIEIDGSAAEYDIPAGECKIVDTGYLAAMDASCTMDVRTVKGVKNVLFGGEGMFNTVINGPGHIVLQSMPVSKTAAVLYSFMPHPSSN